MTDNDSISDISLNRRIGLLRVSIIMAFSSFLLYALFYILYDFQKYLPAIISIFVYLLFNTAILILFRFKKYSIVIHAFSLSVILELMVLTFYLFGKVPGFHFYFILFAFVPLPFFPISKIAYPLFYFIVSLGCFLYIEFFSPTGIIEFPQAFIVPVKLISIILSLGTTMLIFVLYYSKSEKNEKELNDAKNALVYVNQKLIDSNIKIEAQKESLTEANRTKNLFFSIISHDLKNPLSSFVGLSELLNNRIDTYNIDKIKQIAASIASSANDLQGLILNLLEWSRTQTERIEPRYAPCVLQEILEESEAICKEQARQKNIKLLYSVPQGLEIKTDSSVLGTIFRNLFTNAIKYSYPGGEISVRVTHQASKVVISIKDNGMGISKDRVENLFRLDKVKSTPGTNQENGTGLGLIITQEFVKALNGTIVVNSSEGNGCEFVISLPL